MWRWSWKNRKLIEEYGERAKKLLVEAFKDTTIPAIAAHVRNLAKPRQKRTQSAAPYYQHVDCLLSII